MATIKVFASGSSGNCYLLTSGTHRLLLECGIKGKELLSAINYDLNVSAIVSHAHLDHAKGIKTLTDYGVNVYSNNEVAEKHKHVITMEQKKAYDINGYKVMPLEVPHGECQNYAYVIDLPNNDGRLLFCTDAERFRYKVGDVNYIMIEANYSDEILMQKLMDGEDVQSRSENHMEISETERVVKSHTSEDLRAVVLIHLSNGLSHAERFKSRISAVVPTVDVIVAERGTEIEFSKFDF